MLRDCVNELAGPVADTIQAAPDQYDSWATAADLITRAMISWDDGEVSVGLALLWRAARQGDGISPDARNVQPLLVLAAALIDLRQLAEADELLRTAAGPGLRNIPVGAALSLLLSRMHLAVGRLDEAAADAQAALEAAQGLGAHGHAATACCLSSAIELRRGDITAATAHLARRPVTGPQFSDVYARAETVMAEAQLTEAVEGPAAALSHLGWIRTGLATRPGLLLGDPAVAAWLARTAVAAGDNELATSVARAAQILADANPTLPALVAAAAHSRGVAHRDRARLVQAVAQHLDPSARASAEEDMGVLCAEEGDQDQAIHYLDEALDGYRTVGADRDRARVRQRLRELGVRHRHWEALSGRPVAGWDSLTGTEQDVAGLVAQGLNNKQVAARMYISPHTVAHHLRQSFRKLGIASRVELTRIVVERTANNA